jgi:hypothetical protein
MTFSAVSMEECLKPVVTVTTKIFLGASAAQSMDVEPMQYMKLKKALDDAIKNRKSRLDIFL